MFHFRPIFSLTFAGLAISFMLSFLLAVADAAPLTAPDPKVDSYLNRYCITCHDADSE